MEDSRTTNGWFIVVVMSREAGHLALGVGKPAGAYPTIIPEEFPEECVGLGLFGKGLAGSVLKRRGMGQKHAPAVIDEDMLAKLAAAAHRWPDDFEGVAQHAV